MSAENPVQEKRRWRHDIPAYIFGAILLTCVVGLTVITSLFGALGMLAILAVVVVALFFIFDFTDWFVLALALFMPVVTQVSVTIGGAVSLDWWDGIILLIVIRRSIVAVRHLMTGKIRWKMSWIGLALMLYILSFAVSIIAAEYPLLAVVFMVKSFMSYGLFWYLVFRVPSVHYVRQFTQIMLVAAFGIAVLAILQQLSGHGVGLAEFYGTLYRSDVERIRRVGVYGTFVESLVLGAYLGWILPIPVSLTFGASSRVSRRVLLAFLSLFVLTALIFTQSRGAYLMIGVALITLGIVRRRDILRFFGRRSGLIYLPITFVSLIALMICLFVVYPAIVDRIFSVLAPFVPAFATGQSDIFRYGLNSSYGRLEAMNIAWQLFLSHPLIGIGAGNYPVITNEAWAHNSFLQILTERGIIGLLCYLFLLCAMARAIWKWHRTATEPFWHALSAGVVAAFASVIIGGSFNSAETVVQVAFYLWFYTKVAYDWNRLNPNAHPTDH